jgi:hypothetical protein
MNKKKSNWSMMIMLGGITFLIFLASYLVAAETSTKTAKPFMISIEIPPDYQKVQADDSVVVQSEVLLPDSLKTENITDVIIEYTVTDQEGNIITALSETKGGLLRIESIKELPLPKKIPAGTYNVMVSANCKGAIGQASASFEVVEQVGEMETISGLTIQLLLILLIGMTGFFLFLVHLFWKMKKLRRQ